MARIRTYDLDYNVTGSDYWIGTDGNNNNNTKNFSPNSVAQYLNENEVIDSSNSLRYRYDTIQGLDGRKPGTLSFQTEIGAIVPISSLSTFILSKNTQGSGDVSFFLKVLPESKILLKKSDNINIFGIFNVIGVIDNEFEPSFVNVTLQFVSGHGSLEEDKDYIISILDKVIGGGGGGGATNLLYTAAASYGTVGSDTGDDATIPLSTNTNAGLFSPTEKSKLSGIAIGANIGVIPNENIVAGTKTKITYDAKGLVIAGADATTNDIPSFTNKRYVTDSDLITLSTPKENALGNPGIDGYILSSTTGGSRTWIAPPTTTPTLSEVLDASGLLADGDNLLTDLGSIISIESISGNQDLASVLANTIGVTNGKISLSTASGIAIRAYNTNGVAGEFEVTNGVDDIVNFKSFGVVKARISKDGELTATKIIKENGSPSEYLMADGNTTTLVSSGFEQNFLLMGA